MYFMNHKNGDVLKVTVNPKDSAVKNLQLYRQDGLGNYYLDKNSRLKKQDNLVTKEDIIRASKKIGGHNTHHIDKWHHSVDPIYNSEHQITGFKPELELKHHDKIKNAKRYLRHLDHNHADFLFTATKSILWKPINYLKNAIYADRNKEMVLAHKIHKLRK